MLQTPRCPASGCGARLVGQMQCGLIVCPLCSWSADPKLWLWRKRALGLISLWRQKLLTMDTVSIEALLWIVCQDDRDGC